MIHRIILLPDSLNIQKHLKTPKENKITKSRQRTKEQVIKQSNERTKEGSNGPNGTKLTKFSDYLVAGYHKASVTMAIGNFDIGFLSDKKLYDIKVTIEAGGSVKVKKHFYSLSLQY